MRRLIATLALVAAGCCSSPVTSDAGKAVAAENATAWVMAQSYAAQAGWPDIEGLAGDAPDGKPSWRARFQAWRANGLLLDAALADRKMTYAEAYAAAGEVEVP